MPSDYNFNLGGSDLTVGIEIEYPRLGNGEPLVSRGHGTNELQSNFHEPPGFSGRGVYDGTVGLEIVSDELPVEDLPAFYAEAINYTENEFDAVYQPTGLMAGGNTAGTHVHISPLSREEAQELYEMSQTPWMKVLFCSSIANSDDSAAWPVFRGGRYCRMNRDWHDRYSCVNHRGDGHYEWRMPEPMIREHAEILARFLSLFKQDPELARQYAQELLDDADDRITSIRRAEAVGMDIEEVPAVRRSRAEVDPENFYDVVSEEWSMPEIYTVEMDGDAFYVFDTRLQANFAACGIEFSHDDVLYADSLETAAPEVAEDVRRAFGRRNQDEMRETEATETLKEIVKKKKSQ
jgi:hypothetical protein